MDDKQAIFLYGASGHAKVVLDIVRSSGDLRVVALLDDNRALHGSTFDGVTVPGGRETLDQLSSGCRQGLVAIGDNAIRRQIAEFLVSRGIELVSCIHPRACLAGDVVVGAGTVIMAGAVVNPATLIGGNSIINTCASVDHDCRVGSHVHIAPGATLCGGVVVGDGAFVGAGATIIPNLTIGAGAVVAAGATVVSPVAPGVKVAGTPARIMPS